MLPRPIVFSCVALSISVTTARAQVRQTPGAVIDGQVVTWVYVTMKEPASDGSPVPSVDLLFVGRGDSVRARTDDAGSATALLFPGRYRIVTPAPVRWRGREFTWDVPITVARGLGVTELTQSNASTFWRVGGDGVRAAPKDASTAVVLNLFLPGVGHMYAGRPGKGAALLVTDLVGAGAMLSSLSSYQCSDDDCSSSAPAVFWSGFGVAIATTIYAMADAPKAVRDYNRRAGFVVHETRLRPTLLAGAGPVRYVGVSLSGR